MLLLEPDIPQTGRIIIQQILRKVLVVRSWILRDGDDTGFAWVRLVW